eukprot:CAMPEP_0177152660 /NCGR_PEP_ID=MMETSP0367-20130122/653_1 /TAXON_ID=447022 ORGANISM="Scrippsiella hangoei-like, Strain SHHI-4" /NCGR_SAMPLE_ID=MMETSP0367 /ASSEMBLY_ACC=CAM_ASM_000362 /LENGTH=149 /DNA_ID=CAMNT_0018597745 /DNA_START=15 /DNA_END=464 /DNA_ORIENTATION=+
MFMPARRRLLLPPHPIVQPSPHARICDPSAVPSSRARASRSPLACTPLRAAEARRRTASFLCGRSCLCSSRRRSFLRLRAFVERRHAGASHDYGGHRLRHPLVRAEFLGGHLEERRHAPIIEDDDRVPDVPHGVGLGGDDAAVHSPSLG